MVEKKIGRVIHSRTFSPILELFRIVPQHGSQFPDYKAGQYIALSRDNCKLTRKVIDNSGEIKFVYDADESRNPRRGAVTHSYSISSAPFETQQRGYLEFYVVLEMIETGVPGRLSESLFQIDPEADSRLFYMNRITGDFTLDKRAAGFQNIIMVGTGSGLAPFASMIKQLNYEASNGIKHDAKYTLIHANRTYEELGYHKEFLSIEASGKLDFVYVASVSRPSPRDYDDPAVGKGRANNLLRSVFGMPLKEDQDLQEAIEKGEDTSAAQKTLERTIKPVLPQHLPLGELLMRMVPQRTVVLTCGNPNAMDDIKYIAERNNLRFEKEDW